MCRRLAVRAGWGSKPRHSWHIALSALSSQRFKMFVTEKTEAYRSEVVSKMGMVPNFFAPIAGAPEVVRSLWTFAKAAYLESPIPSPFKDRLFIYLSRFCEVRYCVARHCAFLVHAA